MQERIEERRVPSPPPQLPEMREGRPEPIPEAVRALKIVLNEVRIDGATAVPVETLQERATPYVGREITGAQIFELARVLTAVYRNAGYILSQVIVPPQTVTDGILTLRVIEGYVAEVFVEGDPRVANTLAAFGEKIKASRPLSAGVLERYLLIANDLPGVHVRSVLAPSRIFGAADLTLIGAVTRFDVFSGFDNYGSKYLGRGQVSVGVSGHQVLGANDEWSLVGVMAGDDRELAFGQFSYSQMLGTQGVELGAAVSRERTRPGDVFEVYKIRGRADTGTMTLSYPLLRARNRSLLARALFDARNVYGEALGTRVTKDRIRAVRAGVTWTVRDRLGGQNTVDLVYSRGVGGTDDDDPLRSRLAADGRSGKATFEYARFQQIGAKATLTLGASGQWTNEPLLSTEQFALGGRRFGRAYEPAELVGDRALAFRVEPAYLGRPHSTWLAGYQVFGYFDHGKVRYVGARPAGAARSESLASAGIGLRATIARYVNAAVEVAWPVSGSAASYDARGKDPRVLGSVVVRF